MKKECMYEQSFLPFVFATATVFGAHLMPPVVVS